jgi:hypothetical protein
MPFRFTTQHFVAAALVNPRKPRTPRPVRQKPIWQSDRIARFALTIQRAYNEDSRFGPLLVLLSARHGPNPHAVAPEAPRRAPSDYALIAAATRPGASALP